MDASRAPSRAFSSGDGTRNMISWSCALTETVGFRISAMETPFALAARRHQRGACGRCKRVEHVCTIAVQDRISVRVQHVKREKTGSLSQRLVRRDVQVRARGDGADIAQKCCAVRIEQEKVKRVVSQDRAQLGRLAEVGDALS